MNRRTKKAIQILNHRPMTYEAKLRAFTYGLSKKIVKTEEYKRAMMDMVLFGTGSFDPAKCLREMGYQIPAGPG